MKRKASTIKDIAQELNLNISTVSRALSNSKSISDETKKLVQKYAEKVNYRPNAIASSLRMGKGNTIGLVVPSVNKYFFSNLIFGVEAVLNKAGYNLLICQSNESLEKEKQAINTLVNARVDGIIISISIETTSSKHLEMVISRDIPLIQTDRVIEELPTYKIVNDNSSSSYVAVNHLINNGYKKIAHLSGPLHINIYKERFNGYKKAIDNSSLEDKHHYVYENITSTEQAYELTLQLYKEGKLPDAFSLPATLQPWEYCARLKEKGIKAPEEVGIIGFANEPFTEIVSPTITSLNQHSIEMGKEAARIMLDQLANKQENKIPKQIMIEPQLIIRESSSR